MFKPLVLKGILLFLIFSLHSCNSKEKQIIQAGNDPNFNIISHTDIGLESFNRKVVVFGIDIYAVAEVEDRNLLHAANVLAQYLDNDEDGIADDQLLMQTLIDNKAFLVMWKYEDDLDVDPPRNRLGQDLGNDETNPDFVANGKKGRFDASLEEILHLVNGGHAIAYPQVFGQKSGSALANAMDIARGGQFFEIPEKYPAHAWYTYDDETCEYGDCMTMEYLYWSLTSILGAQENRLDEIDLEWKLNTREKVKAKDEAIYALLTDSLYKLPTVLPDGKYRQ